MDPFNQNIRLRGQFLVRSISNLLLWLEAFYYESGYLVICMRGFVRRGLLRILRLFFRWTSFGIAIYVGGFSRNGSFSMSFRYSPSHDGCCNTCIKECGLLVTVKCKIDLWLGVLLQRSLFLLKNIGLFFLVASYARYKHPVHIRKIHWDNPLWSRYWSSVDHIPNLESLWNINVCDLTLGVDGLLYVSSLWPTALVLWLTSINGTYWTFSEVFRKHRQQVYSHVASASRLILS